MKTRLMSALACSMLAAALTMQPAGADSLVLKKTLDGDPSRALKTAAYRCEAPYALRDKDTSLTSDLRAALDEAGFDKQLRNNDLAVAVVDLSNGRNVYAGINDTTMMYAASLPKIAIVLAVVQAISERKIKWTADLSERLSRAINKSSNRDATWAANLVGVKFIEEVLRRPGYCFYGNRAGGLWLGRPYTRRAPSNRDPVGRVNHGATARQVARFYTLLDRGRLADSERILSVMGPPAITHKFVKGLRDRPEAVFLARKSGSWRHFHSDSALIERGGMRYVVVALSRSKKSYHRLDTLVRIIDDVFIERHS